MTVKDKANKIVVFRALQLGDLLCSVPAFRALRYAYPDSHITLIGLPWAQSFANRFPAYFNSFISFPGYPGLPEQVVNPIALVSFLRFVQEQKFDLAIQMQGNGSYVNPLIELFNAKDNAGYFRPIDYCPNHLTFLEYPNYGSEIERHLLLMEHLGIQSQGKHLEFPLSTEDELELASLNLDGKYVCIHPGSRGGWRQWPISCFAKLADYCAEKGFSIVVTGTTDESNIASEMIALMKYKAINTVGKTSLGAVGVLIKQASLLISNCTGVSHIASALKTPSVVISMDGEPTRWGPINRNIHKVIDWTKTPDYNKVLLETISLL